tara:strand:+ start:154 stop:1299 length:1146 start_codon:yes stop_codon:yes gene_type:complete
MDINISDNKYSNIDVTNITRINNFNFGNYENLVHINNVINTDSNGVLILDKSNTTYVINSTDYDSNNIYIKQITSVEKLKKDTFVSNNHNLKKNDIITLHNINNDISSSSNTNNLLNNVVIDTDITFTVTTVTRNTFTLISSNGIKDILKTSSNISNGYFKLNTTKSIDTQSKIVNINIDNNNENIGIYYNLIINTDINSLTINCLNNDKLNGYVIINNQHMISSPYTEISNNKSKLVLNNIDLKYSYYTLINISKNNWYIKGNIYNNIINYKLTYIDPNFKLNNINAIHHFYKNYTYIIDTSDSSLDTKQFTLHINNNHYYKNVIQTGIMGTANSYIKIYISNDEVVDSIYQLKYKKNSSDGFFTYTSFYTIKDSPIYFI